MHNRVGPEVQGGEMRVGEALVLVPMTLVIVAFALYPQFALKRAEDSTKASLAAVAVVKDGGALAQAAAREDRP
jgi:NADH-quinone oxidoreductase subunit M